MIYVAGCVFSMMLAWLGIRTKSYRREVLFYTIIISALPIFLISALRYDVGTDYLYMYKPYFESLKYGVEIRNIEPLYKIINHIVLLFSGEFQWVVVICSFLFVFLVYSQIFWDSPYPVFSIFLLFGMLYYFISLNAMRQMVGVAILFYSIRYVESSSFCKFILCVVAATGFHYSCVLFSLMFIISRISIRPRMAFVMTSFVLLFDYFVLKYFISFLSAFGYGRYFGSVFDDGNKGYWIMGIQVLLVAFTSLFYRSNVKYQIYYNLGLISMWLSVLSGSIVLIERLRWMFGISSIILVPLAISNIANNQYRIIFTWCIIICFMMYSYIVIGIRNSQEVLPYQFVF